jgi:hypothetical protein
MDQDAMPIRQFAEPREHPGSMAEMFMLRFEMLNSHRHVVALNQIEPHRSGATIVPIQPPVELLHHQKHLHRASPLRPLGRAYTAYV